jgi:hypothetical protein
VGRSPVPLRSREWMTDLIAAGFLVSYSGGLLLLPLFFAH